LIAETKKHIALMPEGKEKDVADFNLRKQV